MKKLGNSIQICERTFKNKVNKIEDANDRTSQNIRNLRIEYSGSSMEYLEDYSKTIDSLKNLLDSYYNLLVADIKTLGSVSDHFKDTDRNLS